MVLEDLLFSKAKFIEGKLKRAFIRTGEEIDLIVTSHPTLLLSDIRAHLPLGH